MERSGLRLLLRYYLSICREKLRKPTENLTQDSWSPGRDSKPEPPDYETGVLTNRPLRSVKREKTPGVEVRKEVYFQRGCNLVRFHNEMHPLSGVFLRPT
jgi:hypothetical protein